MGQGGVGAGVRMKRDEHGDGDREERGRLVYEQR
jgi:hypothetical protein